MIGYHEAKALTPKLSPAQRRALDQIACGDDSCLNRRTVLALEARGLVEGYDETLPEVYLGRYRIRIRRYTMPPGGAHLAWCEIAASEPEDNERP